MVNQPFLYIKSELYNMQLVRSAIHFFSSMMVEDKLPHHEYWIPQTRRALG